MFLCDYVCVCTHVFCIHKYIYVYTTCIYISGHLFTVWIILFVCTCMCVCAWSHIYLCICVCLLCLLIHMCACMCMYSSIHVHTCFYLYVSYVCVSVFVFVFVYKYLPGVHLGGYMCVHVCVWAHVRRLRQSTFVKQDSLDRRHLRKATANIHSLKYAGQFWKKQKTKGTDLGGGSRNPWKVFSERTDAEGGGRVGQRGRKELQKQQEAHTHFPLTRWHLP